LKVYAHQFDRRRTDEVVRAALGDGEQAVGDVVE
jgi:hypothetical protein